MSAPRKIWAHDDGLNSPDSRTWSAMVPIGPAYHHDDVVRELVEVLKKAKAFHDRDEGCNGFTADYEILRAEIDTALTKIAQEG